MSRIFTTSFASLYPHYVTNVEWKGRTKAGLDHVIQWLSGFETSQRWADKLVDELAKGKPMDRILRGNGHRLTGRQPGGPTTNL